VKERYHKSVNRLDSNDSEQNTLGGTNQGMHAEVSLEKHYSVDEVSKLWGLSSKTVRTLFKREPGVVELGTGGSRFKRAYVTRRIPESVVKRVHSRLRKTA
jgi:AraC-like DNA-binding protein